MKLFVSIFLLLSLCSCTGTKKIPATDIKHLQFVGQYTLPHNLSFKNTIVGGLSGIDYDPGEDLYYLICDDASVFDPVRFYTAKIHVTGAGIDSVSLVDMKFLRQHDGRPFPNTNQNAAEATDPEAMRFDPKTKTLVWSSEGERRVNKDPFILTDALVRISDTKGNYTDSFILPSNLKMYAGQRGPRHNSVFEGVTFVDKKTLFVSVEEPLYEDGPPAGVGDSSAWVRLVKFDRTTKQAIAQYAYRVEPVADVPDPPGAFRLNGVTDILSISKDKLLVVERSYSTGRRVNVIRVFTADLAKATDVSGLTLSGEVHFVPAVKRHVITIEGDNIEGVTFGPSLPNGRKSLIFISDNNFSKNQITQFLLYEIR